MPEYLTPTEPQHRWHEDIQIISIVPAAPGWWGLFHKSEGDEGYDPRGTSIHDLAWVEPIACFALVEYLEREEVSHGLDEDGKPDWQPTGRDERDVRSAGGEGGPYPHFLLRSVRPVWLHSGEGELWTGVHDGPGPSLLLGPGYSYEEPWVLERMRPIKRDTSETPEPSAEEQSDGDTA